MTSRSKREIATTRSDDETSQRHIDHLTVTFEGGEDERQFVLDLQLNRQLIPDNYFQRTHKQVGLQMTSQNPESTSRTCFELWLALVKQSDQNVQINLENL